MKQKNLITGTMVSLAMFAIILDGQTAISGSQEALSLCIQTIIPSLFPFLVLSILQVNILSSISLKILQPISHLFGIPEGTEAILISGLLGGYPVGAKCTSAAYHSGVLKRHEAEHILAFCNNVGPSFLFGIVYASFPDLRYVWLLWGVHILSAFFVAITLQKQASHPVQHFSSHIISISNSLQQALSTVATICGWVILFRVLLCFLKRWILWIFPLEFQIALIGFLELTNGCLELQAISSLSLRFVICSCMLAFGGICVFMQTVSVTLGISLRLYMAGKLLQTLYSFLLSFGIAYHIPHITFPILLLLIITTQKIQKKYSIHAFNDV